jgi:hypothetical protein
MKKANASPTAPTKGDSLSVGWWVLFFLLLLAPSALIIVDYTLVAIHTDGLGGDSYEHLDDDERDALLDDDRFVSLVTSTSGDDTPVVIEPDVQFNAGFVLQQNLTVLQTVVRRAIVKRIQLITRQNGEDVFVDVLERLLEIERTVNVDGGTLETYEVELAQAMMLFNNTAVMAEAACANYTDLVTLEEQQQFNLTGQDLRIRDLEDNSDAIYGPGGNLTLFEAYNVTQLIALFEQLETDVLDLEVDVNTLLGNVQMLQVVVDDFINASLANGVPSQVLETIVNETLTLTGQIGTLYVDSTTALAVCTNTSANATALLALINAQIAQINFTQVTVINETLIQVGLDLDAIALVLDAVENETAAHTLLIAQVAAYNTSVQLAKLNIETLANETRDILSLINATSNSVHTTLDITNTTLTTFITLVETFINSSNAALLADVVAANTTLYEEYALLITNFTTLDERVTRAALNLTALWTRVNAAQPTLTTLESDVLALDADVATLTSGVATLAGLAQTLATDAVQLETDSTTLLTDYQTLNTSFVTLQQNVSTANDTANAQQLLIDDHQSRIEVLEALVAGFANGTTYYSAIQPALTAGATVGAGDVVSLDETGRVVPARGIREVDRFVFAQQFNSVLVGDVLTVDASSDIHAGAATAIDARDNVFLTLNYGGDNVTFEGSTLADLVPSIITDNRDRVYSGVGDVLVIKYTATQRFAWMVTVDSALSATIGGMAVDSVTQNVWVAGSVLSTGGDADFGLSATSRNVVFRNAAHEPVYTHQIGVGAADVLSNVAIGFLGSLTQSGDWDELHIFEADGYAGSGADFAVLNDVEVNRDGEVYACGFYNRDVSAQTISWLRVNLDLGTTTLLAQLARGRADLAIPAAIDEPYLHAVSRGSGMYLKYTPTTIAAPGTVAYWRSDEGVDDNTAPGVHQAPIRFVHIAVDQADNVFLQGWHGYDAIDNAALDVLFDTTFTLDASNAATVSVNIGREQAGTMTLLLARIDPVDGDYRWLASDVSTVGGDGAVFKENHRFAAAANNQTTRIYNFYDPAYQSDIMLTHRGDLVFVGRTDCDALTLNPLRLRYIMESAETAVTDIVCNEPSHQLIKFEGLSGEYMRHVSDSASDFIGPSRAVIGPDSYIWFTYRTTSTANLDGSGVLTPPAGALSFDYFYKLDPDFNVIWGRVRSSDISFVQEVSGFMVDRRRNLWYVEDIYSGAQTVNVTQFPAFEPASLAFSLVRNVDMTHIPIGVATAAAAIAGPVDVVMEGIVESNVVPTIQGRNYCNFHGVLQTSRCYSMPSMGFAPVNGSLVVDIHRDALRIPTTGRGVY